MLIFGRSPTLVLGALVAIFNVAVGFHIAGFNPTADQIAQVNIALGALVALVAGNTATTIAAGKAAEARANGTTPTTGP